MILLQSFISKKVSVIFAQMKQLIGYLFVTLVLILTSLNGSAQKKYITISGVITDDLKQPLELVNISLKTAPSVGTTSDKDGKFIFRIPFSSKHVVVFSMLGYETVEYALKDAKGSRVNLFPVLKNKTSDIGEVLISESRNNNGSFVKLDPKAVHNLPNASGGIEGLVKTLPGVASNNELSSQYSVRGGNFDENLVFVNDIEIYRPMLIRSGQQEGLSFINPDMVSSINFSAGGFDPSYGDKMSSVLDIKYKIPTEYNTTVSASMLGASVHFEGADRKKRFTHNSGFRYKTNQYLLGTLDEKGEYEPNFFDFQTFLNYRISPKADLSFIGYIAKNKYNYYPKSRETRFGTYNIVRNIRVFYEGKEEDEFNTMVGALTFNYHPNINTNLKWVASSYFANEKENYDILGEYLFSELETNQGSNQFGKDKTLLGVGGHHEFARNQLEARIHSLSHKGKIRADKHFLQWGATFKHERIEDQMREWERRDSAGYSTPYNDKKVLLYESIRQKHSINSNRISAYVQDAYTLPWLHDRVNVSAGVRVNYWDYNKEFLISPRASVTWEPQWEDQWLFRLASGFYHQPPFFKELKNLDGEINPNTKAQKSFQVVAGADHLFSAWDRPFKFTAEAYYKYLYDLIPYEIENVRIRYLSDQLATGYAAGLDMKVNGEFVSGIQSWASLSLMKTQENIIGDGKGYIPRPTDQRFNFNLFIQDFMPSNPNFNAHLSLNLGGKLPFGPPKSPKYMHTLRMPLYRRLDLGFSRVFISNALPAKRNSIWSNFKDLRVTLDVFNILDINNTVSYFWVSDVNNYQWAVPSYLTGRRFNIRITAKF
ncbi:TonB-dependent receptor [Prolixibacteraceae bacterium JC049]|nr:TonB-dependent receptor [Prolixibacteraceae bacterium JC049]